MLEHSIQSADGTRLRLVQWSPDGDAKSQVLIVHGLAEHAERYTHVAAALTAASYQVSLVELRGHGKSEGKRGHVDNWVQYVEDLTAAAAFLREELHLVTHSMGGLVALDALRESTLRTQARDLVLSNPLTGVAVKPPLHLELAKGILSRLLPALSLKNPLDPSTISRDPEVVRRYVADPLIFDTITPRWATEMEAAIERVQAYGPRYDLPALAMLGTGDKISDHTATERLMAAWGHDTADVKRYPGFYHEIFNEPEQDQVIGDLLRWLDSRD